MSYKTRNIIILLSFNVLVIIFGGYLTLWSYPARIEKEQSELQKIEQQIQQLDGIEAEFPLLQEKIREKEQQLSGLNKKIVAQVPTSETYRYLNIILKKIGFLEFNLLYSDNEEYGNYGCHVFHIKGEGSFEKIYRFIGYLEEGPEIYTIRNLNLHAVESKDPKSERFKLLIPFDMELRAYYANVENLPITHRRLSDVRLANLKNPFRPYVLRNLPPNTDNLLEVERADLKAVIPGKALVADHNGRVHTLEVGDRVYLGYLAKVNPETNEAEFILNKGGIFEKIVLRLKFDQNKELEGGR